jgi:signal transduction histidine kinase
MTTDLATWIEQNAYELIIAASETLSQNTLLQSHAAEAVAAFYDALLRSARTFDPTPLYTILFDWVDGQSSPTGDETSSLVPVIAQLKATTGEQIFRLASPEEAVALYYAADSIYTDALVFMASLEAEDMLITAHEQQKKAEQEIARLNKSKSDFIGVAAHELKTPLTVIEGYTGMLRGLGGANDDMLQMVAGGIEGGARRLREIVEDLVDVSMIELKVLDLHSQPVWLHQILEALERSVQSFVEQRQQSLYIDRDAMPRDPLFADPERLLQAFNKVLANAIKYTPDGGQIAIGVESLPGFIDVMISDTGVGIQPSRLPVLFDPFSSGSDVALHSSGKVKFMGGGPGLGLAIAKGILEAHGGSIWAESPGYNEQTYPGSTFHMLIPLRQEPPGPA